MGQTGHLRRCEAMARDTRKRWLARITLVALAGLIGLAVWLRWRTQPRLDKAPGPAVLHETGPLGPTDPDASLVVTESLHDKPEHRTRVVRYDFKNGRVQPPETLWEGSYQRFGSLGGLPPIVANRYLVAASGSVIDLQEKTLIHEGAGRLLEVRGDRVVSGVSNDWGKLERLAAFNFRTCVIDKLTDREAEEFRLRSELREERSPDGMKSVVASKNVLTLFHVGHPPKEWGIFKLGDYPTHSGLWIDNERFLTQDGNGNLLTVRLDGTRVPVMRVPLEAKTKSSPYFRRDTDGRIIYSCSGTQFFIDTEAKSWERCEWESRGHGFEESCDDQMRRIYRYKGTEIARSPFWTRMGPYEALTTESYIAVFVESDLLVWSAGTGKWTTLGTRTDQIAGWIK
jgi:hypothetical protein